MHKSTKAGDFVEHLALPRMLKINLFAVGQQEGTVTVWSFSERKQIGEFPTILDFGGRRLAVVSSRRPIIFAGSWSNGITAYAAERGDLLWSRSDLRRIQQVCDLSDDKLTLIGVGLESGPYHILQADTGEDHSKLAGIESIYASVFDPLYLLVDHQKHVHLSGLRLPSIWKRPLISFAVLHAAFSPKAVAFSETGGSVFCFDFYGTKLWEFQPPADNHILRLVWDIILERWLAIDWNFQYGGPKHLFEIDADGKASMLMTIGDCHQAEFSHDGNYIITSAGEIVSTRSGATEWAFE